ncbi:integrase [Chryseobacterium bernardetii]|uniref:Integrase n=1 Tax=Chryseobacterium bernardetii TaxID=1241978 RepID=A0ACC6J0Q4_9FLAO|nr:MULTISPECIES: site-specific integrase [Chryseobacterium]MDR6373030.1 integrase [Chryseobacterium vietnamense]MDR6443468.1 integrase [Chryseobacterium bernardetii]
MLVEQSYGLTFFLKSSKNEKIRHIYVRITVDGIPKETSTKRKWYPNRWDQKEGKAVGTKEDAKIINVFLESLMAKINNHRTELMNNGLPITSIDLINFVNGKYKPRNRVLEEFQEHNDEMGKLVETGEYTKGTHDRYITARSHVQEFIKYQYNKEDIEFRVLNYEFVKDYDLYLKTVRKCAINTSLKYISNFKKIVLRAIAKEIIPKDPFKLFIGKKTKIRKKPLTKAELRRIEEKEFSSERLSVVRDIFVFQCYTGLSYIDAFQLKWEDVKEANDGSAWIMSSRQKSKSDTDIPLLPKALEIIAKYKDNPLCLKRGTVLPGRSNQKMNEYLKEIAVLCNMNVTLNTHKARRTFASTITLNNGVSIHVVKEMLGHHSVKQTEDYAITEQESIAREMKELEAKLRSTDNFNRDPVKFLEQLEKEFHDLKNAQKVHSEISLTDRCNAFENMLNRAKTII